MSFTSLSFLFFFPLVIILYSFIPGKYKSFYLLICSYVFYISIKPIFVLLLLFSTLITYFTTKRLALEIDEKKRLIILWINIFLLIFPLLFFKYFPAINSLLISLLADSYFYWPFSEFDLFLPIGISFYTFMAIGYTIDIYNDDVKWESSIVSIGLFLSYFPIVLSGPIERSGSLLPQFKTLNKLRYVNISEGFKLMIWGYFMKLVIADRLGIYITTIYSNISYHNGNSLLLASLLYPFQLYTDLGGYSLVAIGMSKCFGITVISNFNKPFFAKSMSELWRRWHISLIKWLTDYVYTPLAFNFRKYNLWGIVISLIITFLISGIWHGADLVFVIWGIIQGFYLCIEAITKKYRLNVIEKFKLSNNLFFIMLSILTTYFLFAFSQIFARPYSVDESLIVITKIIYEKGPLFIDELSLAHGLFFLFILLISDFIEEYYSDKLKFINSNNLFVRFSTYLLILVVIVLFGVLDGGDFIYFKY